MNRRLLVRGVSFLFLLSCQTAIANPAEELFGASPRVKAMGGVGSVLAQDFSATFYNPANLPRCTKNVVTLGYDFVGSNLQVRNAAGDTLKSRQVGSYHASGVGACVSPFTNLGVGIYASAGLQMPMDSELRTLESTPQFFMYNGGLKSPSVMAGLGYKFLPQLSIGIAATFAASAFIRQDAVFPPLGDQEFGAVLYAQVKPRAGMIAGVTFEPVPTVRTALVYRSSSYSKFNVQANINAAMSLDVPVNFVMENVLDYSPQQIAFGVSYQPVTSLLLAADATYAVWSLYSSPFIRARPAEGAVLTQNIKFPPDERVMFRDTIVPRIGAEYIFDGKASIRAGYTYRMTPAPIPSQTANIIDNDVHRVTLGAGYRLASNNQFAIAIDGFVAVDVMANRNIQKAANIGGDPKLPIPEPRAYSFGGTALNTGVALSAEY